MPLLRRSVARTCTLRVGLHTMRAMLPGSALGCSVDTRDVSTPVKHLPPAACVWLQVLSLLYATRFNQAPGTV